MASDPRARLDKTRTEWWYCGVYESGYHNGARCSPEDAHTESRWGCGYRYVYSGQTLHAALTTVLDLLDEYEDDIKSALFSETPIPTLIRTDHVRRTITDALGGSSS